MKFSPAVDTVVKRQKDIPNVCNNCANNRKNITPIVGKISHQSSEKSCVNHRKLEGKGAVLIEEGAASLKSMVAKIDTTKMNNPSFLMVLTGTGDYAYRRQDGVYVVPIGCLKD